MRIAIPEGQPQLHILKPVDRPASLDGLRIGLLDNCKAPVDKMNVHLEQRLRERIPGVQPLQIAKRDMGKPAPPEVMKALEDVDVVINALGD